MPAGRQQGSRQGRGQENKEAGMGEVKSKWTGGRQFLATDEQGHSVVTDTEGMGIKPSEMLLAALVGCAGVDLVGILEKKRQKVTAIEARASKLSAPEPPWTIEKIEVEWTVRGRNLKVKAVEEAVHLAEDKYCSVKASLTSEVVTTVKVVNEEGE
jgi:putative redox protein